MREWMREDTLFLESIILERSRNLINGLIPRMLVFPISGNLDGHKVLDVQRAGFFK